MARLRALMEKFNGLTPVWRWGSIGASVAVVAAVVVVIVVAGGGSTPHSSAATNASIPSTTSTPGTSVSAKGSHKGRKHGHHGANGSGQASGGSSGGSSGGGGGGGGSSCSSGATTGSGEVVMYGNSPGPQFQPVLNAFAKAYPNVKINYQDVDDPVAFSKYSAEHAQGARTADIIMESSPALWTNNKDIALCWKPSDASSYPSWLEQFPGVLIAAPDPAISIYSKPRLAGHAVPTTFAQLVSDLKRHPDLFKGKIATYSVNNSFGYSAFWELVQQHGWSWLNALGPASKPQADGTALAEQLASGAANYGFLESGLVRGAITGTVAQLVGWTYMHDFTPLIPRGIAITKGAANPAAAKVFLNWMFSSAGQQAMCAAGFTAYMSGVSCSNSLASVQQAVGASNVVLVPFHSSIASDQAAFTQHWHSVFG